MEKNPLMNHMLFHIYKNKDLVTFSWSLENSPVINEKLAVFQMCKGWRKNAVCWCVRVFTFSSKGGFAQATFKLVSAIPPFSLLQLNYNHYSYSSTIAELENWAQQACHGLPVVQLLLKAPRGRFSFRWPLWVHFGARRWGTKNC